MIKEWLEDMTYPTDLKIKWVNKIKALKVLTLFLMLIPIEFCWIYMWEYLEVGLFRTIAIILLCTATLFEAMFFAYTVVTWNKFDKDIIYQKRKPLL